MRITILQLNPTIGAVEENFDKIKREYLKVCYNSDLVVCPELCLIGYPPNDLLFRSKLIDQQDLAINRLLNLTFNDRWNNPVLNKKKKKAALIIGAAMRNNGKGKPFHNSALVMKNGDIILIYHKQLLPTENIFDERRYFEPGRANQKNTFKLNGKKIGVLICEDAWNSDKYKQNYPTNPLERLRNKIDLLVTLNASPSDILKNEKRYEMYQIISQDYGFPIVYVNQVGGQDELIFDGHSFIISTCKQFFIVKRLGLICLEGFYEHSQTVEVNFDELDSLRARRTLPNNFTLPTNWEDYVYRQLKLGLKDYLRKTGFKKVVIALSGGIDSVATALLCKEYLGAENVTCILMPSKVSSEGSVSDSVKFCHLHNIEFFTYHIEQAVELAISRFDYVFSRPPEGIALENIQARERGKVLMTHSNQFGALPINTSNKSELSVGYSTLYGDQAGGLSLIGDCYKTEIYDLMKWLNMSLGYEACPKNVLKKAPSAELRSNQKDTDSLPDYNKLDPFLKLVIEGDYLPKAEKDELKAKIQLTKEEQLDILGKIDRAEYKRKQFAPILRIHVRSFGFGRNMPIAQRFKY